MPALSGDADGQDKIIILELTRPKLLSSIILALSQFLIEKLMNMHTYITSY